MKIYINEKKLLIKDLDEMSTDDLLNFVQDNLNKEIINEIILNGISVNFNFLKENVQDFSDYNTIIFKTKKNKDLIKETIAEANKYLPKLKKGVLDAATLFRKNELKKANKKFQQLIDGIEWYLNVTYKINELANKDKGIKKELLDELDNFLSEIIIAHKNEDIILLADLLEYEIAEFINEFINYNNLLFNEVNLKREDTNE